MVITLQGSERPSNTDYFDKVFRMRHEIFVTGRGWSLPTVNGREIDQYDVDETTYFLDINEDDIIEGSVRLTPTEEYSLLADYFPHLVENGMSPRGPAIYEATRYIVLPQRKNRQNNRAAKARLLSSMMRWALKRNAQYIQTVIDTATLSSFVEMTPQTIPLGLSSPYGGGRSAPGGGECMAIRWPVNVEVLSDIITYGGLAPHLGGLPPGLSSDDASMIVRH